ncbi:MAG: isoprenylcysteine carboxylmethyltransferase family protein [Candidatus Acidiferrales bacterium]
MQGWAYVIVLAGISLWVAPFILAKRHPELTSQIDKRARWGILLEMFSFAVLWQGRFWEHAAPEWRAVCSVLFFVAAAGLSWTSARALGMQWRIDAGLNAEHELVMHGPYSLVRHPIYTSLLCMLCGVGFMMATWPMFALSVALFVAGTEIRVHVEEGLLSGRFGETFQKYRQSVSAYIPLVR